MSTVLHIFTYLCSDKQLCSLEDFLVCLLTLGPSKKKTNSWPVRPASCRGLPLDERQSAAELEAVLQHHHNLQEKLADDMLNLARNLKNNSLAAQNIIKQDNQVTELTDTPSYRLRISMFLFILSYCLFIFEMFLFVVVLAESVHKWAVWHKNNIHFWKPFCSILWFIICPSLTDPESIDASGGFELWEAEDGVGATGAAHQEVCQLAAVAHVDSSLLHLHQHDPLYTNLPEAPMMTEEPRLILKL